MDGNRFDHLTRRVGTGITRRRAVASLLGLATGAVVLRDQAEATRCREGGRACVRDGDCCANRCVRSQPGTVNQDRFVCGCTDGRTLCGSRCIDTRNNVAACGRCGNRCRAGQTCENGVCTGRPSATAQSTGGPTNVPSVGPSVSPTVSGTVAPTPVCTYDVCGANCCAQNETCTGGTCSNPCSAAVGPCLALAEGGTSIPGVAGSVSVVGTLSECTSSAQCETVESVACASVDCLCVAATYFGATRLNVANPTRCMKFTPSA